MSTSKEQGDLFPSLKAPEGSVVINDRCLVRTQDGHRLVMVSGIVLAQYAVGDRMAEAHAMVSLVEQGWADQNDVAQAFGTSARTLRRYEQRFAEGGLAALGRAGGYPKGRARLRATRTRWVNRLKSEGLSNCAIAQRLGVSEKAIRKLLRRLGWKAPTLQQGLLPLEGISASDPNLSAFLTPPPAASPPATSSSDPNVSAFSSASEEESLPESLDTDPTDRRLDRLLAFLGLLDDAAPLFASGPRLPRAGVLLALPAVVASGILECARKIYGGIGPAFYGLRTSIVALLLMALWRIKRPEALKEFPPADLVLQRKKSRDTT